MRTVSNPCQEFPELLEVGILASQPDPFDPMEKALKQTGSRYLKETEQLHDDWNLVREYPLSQELLSVARVWQSADHRDYLVAAKGAPGAIAELCHFSRWKSKTSGFDSWQARDCASWCGQSFQFLNLPKDPHEFAFKFIGMVGFADPVRPGVPDAMRECYKAGIRVIMITGDYPATALSIARKIGLSAKNVCITGAELADMDETTFKSELRRSISLPGLCRNRN